MKKIFSALISIFLFAISVTIISAADSNFSFSTTTPSDVKAFTDYYYTIGNLPSSLNYHGIQGTLSLTSNISADHLAGPAPFLVQIYAYPQSVCPATGQIPVNYTKPTGVLLQSFILGITKPGTMSLPVNIALPYPYPLQDRCISIFYSGGEHIGGTPVTINTNLTLNYDTNTAPSITPNPFIDAGFEYCIGLSTGCGTGRALTLNPGDAFAMYINIKADATLTAINGNASYGSLEEPNPPTGAWSESTNIYYVPNCTLPANPNSSTQWTSVYGPSSQFATPPVGSVSIYQYMADLNGRDRILVPISQNNLNLQVKNGGCYLSIAKFNGTGGMHNETQLEIETIPPQTTTTTTGTPAIGAIRWDDWYGNLNEIGAATEKTLGPAQWHFRVPFFGKLVSPTQVSWSYSQEVIDKEIAFAKASGLNYWAFVEYQPNDHLSDALNYYLTSSRKQEINFALIAGPVNFGDDTYGMSPFVAAKKDRFISLLKEPSYQKVLGNRPLIYLFGVYDAWVTTWGGKNMIDELRTAAQTHGLGNPYIVVMGFDPNQARSWQIALGADAISTYASQNCGNGTSYPSLVAGVESFWNLQKNTGSNVIPIVMAGWDRRSRVAQWPLPWDNPNTPPASGEGNIYCQKAIPTEIAGHLRDAISWTHIYSSTNPANTILIYAWNENDEGGWLTPTIYDGDARLEAISQLLNGSSFTSPRYIGLDANGDRRIDLTDYQSFISNFGNPYTIFDYNNLVANFGK